MVISVIDKNILWNHSHVIMQGENNSDTVVFETDKTYGNIDLSGSSAFLAVVNSNGEGDKIPLSMSVKEDKLWLEWKITRSLTTVKGILSIQIVFESAEDVIHKTLVKNLEVKSSVDSDTPIEQEYPTILQSWEQRMENLNISASNTLIQATQAKDTAISSASTAISNAQSASLNKDATDTNKEISLQYSIDSQQYALTASEQAVLAEHYAQQAQSIISSIPMRYYRPSVAQMEAITTAKQGDLCYIVNFSSPSTKLYVYDTTDMDADNNNPEWVFLGNLDFANMDKATLLNILQLPTVATTGSYTDLLNKPNRYESFITLTTGAGHTAWDYSVSDKAICTLPYNAILYLDHIYNGAVGLLILYPNGHELTLPENSIKSMDFDYVTIGEEQHYIYTFVYDGVKFHWSRTVADNE
ncbi:MAG: hypothetical protein K0R90_1675 [Oscillospiraceae bacterium]|jgi:hypothetical protein|nr:hypothetical protein [Oscillospiraceae bacterium]